MMNYRMVKSKVNELPANFSRLQPFIYKKLHAHLGSDISASTLLLRRLSAWLPGIQMRHVEISKQQIKLVCRSTQPYMGLAPLRIMCRAVCTAARFHSAPLPCCFGCAQEDGADDLKHYVRCPALKALAEELFRGRLPLPVPGSPWLSGLLPLARRAPEVRLLSAAFLDAFVTAHSNWRHHPTDRASHALRARIRQQTKRHKAMVRAWAWLDQQVDGGAA